MRRTMARTLLASLPVLLVFALPTAAGAATSLRGVVVTHMRATALTHGVARRTAFHGVLAHTTEGMQAPEISLQATITAVTPATATTPGSLTVAINGQSLDDPARATDSGLELALDLVEPGLVGVEYSPREPVVHQQVLLAVGEARSDLVRRVES